MPSNGSGLGTKKLGTLEAPMISFRSLSNVSGGLPAKLKLSSNAAL